VFTITGLAGCTFTSLYLISATGIKQNSYDFFGGSFGTTADLKLARLPLRSPLPFAALPSVSLLPAAPLADDTDPFIRRLPSDPRLTQI
jgi:hypothetical protein